MTRLRATVAPYLMVLPGWLWLVAFFVVPLAAMASLSTQTGDVIRGYRQTFRIQTYLDAWQLYHDQLLRSLLFGLLCTVICLLIGYPVAYAICFHGGRRKSTYLFTLLLPFFVSFVLRTQSWRFLLADDGVILSPLKHAGLLPSGFHVLSTSYAVVFGLAYNSLPFMVLPIYVALERVDGVLLEAAADLYATGRQTLLRVVLPLSLPGVFAGVLLTFIPASSDYVNATILGGTSTTMIGNVIQTQYLTNLDYPMGSALSFGVMAVLLVGLMAYARSLGTRHVLEAVGA